MNAALRLTGAPSGCALRDSPSGRPGVLVPALRVPRAALRLVLRFGLYGPLIGGLPYNVFLLPIPFSYLIGGVPALLAGAAFALWWFGPAQQRLGAGWRALSGALCGAAGSAAAALFAAGTGGVGSLPSALALLCLHGVPAGAIAGVALARRAAATEER